MRALTASVGRLTRDCHWSECFPASRIQVTSQPRRVDGKRAYGQVTSLAPQVVETRGIEPLTSTLQR